MQHTTPPGMTQGRRATLLRLRNDLDAMREWHAMHGACEGALLRIDALLTGQAPTVQAEIDALLPRLAALLDALPGEYTAVRRGVTQCIGVMEDATGRDRTFPNERTRRDTLLTARHGSELVQQ